MTKTKAPSKRTRTAWSVLRYPFGFVCIAVAFVLWQNPDAITFNAFGTPDNPERAVLGDTLHQLLRAAMFVAVCAIVFGGFYLTWRRRHTSRADRLYRLREALARETHTIPEHLTIKIRRWDKHRPVEGYCRYSSLFDDSEGSVDREAVEELLRRKIGGTLTISWTPADDVVRWEPRSPLHPLPYDDVSHETSTEETASARSHVLARIQAGVEAALKSGVEVEVPSWQSAIVPSVVRVKYTAAANVHLDGTRDAVEDKMTTLLPGEWRAVWDTNADVVVFTDTPDPLAKPVGAAPLAETVDLAALLLGRQESGDPWRLRLMGTHVLIGGASGSGKGSVLWSIVHALTPALVDGSVMLWAIDPKGGMELGRGRGVWDRFAVEPHESVALLKDAVAYMRARAGRLAADRTRLHKPTPAQPLLVIVIDEIATLTKYVGDRKDRDEINGLIGLLLSQGRAAGVVVVGAVQDPRKEVLNLRDLFTTRIALRLQDKVQPDMVLGDGARGAGARADRIAITQPGTGYVMRDGEPEPHRVRAMWVDDDMIDRIVATAQAGRKQPALFAALPAANDFTRPKPVHPDDVEEGDRIVIDLDGEDVTVTVTGRVEAVDDESVIEIDYRTDDKRVGCIAVDDSAWVQPA